MVSKSLHRSVDLVNSLGKIVISNRLISAKDRVLLAISGGQDSICLLVILNQLHAQMEINIGLVWCHHLWQIDSFSLMRQMTKISYLFQLNSGFAVTPKPIPSELLARNWRHNSSQRICLFYNYYKLSLAHSANDKVETILLNLMRGTGVTGLSPLRWEKQISENSVKKREHVSKFFLFSVSFFFWSPFFVSKKKKRKKLLLLFQKQEVMKKKNKPVYKKNEFLNKKKNAFCTLMHTKLHVKNHNKPLVKVSGLGEITKHLQPIDHTIPTFGQTFWILEKMKLKKSRRRSGLSQRFNRKKVFNKINSKKWFYSASYAFLKDCSTSLEQLQENTNSDLSPICVRSLNLEYPYTIRNHTHWPLVNFLGVKLKSKSRHFFIYKSKDSWYGYGKKLAVTFSYAVNSCINCITREVNDDETSAFACFLGLFLEKSKPYKERQSIKTVCSCETVQEIKYKKYKACCVLSTFCASAKPLVHGEGSNKEAEEKKETDFVLKNKKDIPTRLFFPDQRHYILKAENVLKKKTSWNILFQKTGYSNFLLEKRRLSIIRPLLSLNRFEISQLCIFWHLPVYPDKSNQKVSFLRNRVRKQLLPTIKLFFNSRIENVLLQFAEIFSSEDSFMNQLSNELFKNFTMSKTALCTFTSEMYGATNEQAVQCFGNKTQLNPRHFKTTVANGNVECEIFTFSLRFLNSSSFQIYVKPKQFFFKSNISSKAAISFVSSEYLEHLKRPSFIGGLLLPPLLDVFLNRKITPSQKQVEIALDKQNRKYQTQEIFKFKNTSLSPFYVNYSLINYVDHDRLILILTWTKLKVIKSFYFSLILLFKRADKNVELFYPIQTIPRYSVPIGATFWVWNRKLCLGKQLKKKFQGKRESALLITSNKTFNYNVNPQNISMEFWEKRTCFHGPKVLLKHKKTAAITFSPNFVKSKLSHNKKIGKIFTYKFFLKFDALEMKKKEIYWPLLISFFPIALQRRFVKLFFLNQNWKKIRYSQIEHFIAVTRKLSLLK